MKQRRREDGTWEDGPASPKLLPQHMRNLPGEVIAKDDADPDRITEDDAPHIVRNLAKEYFTEKPEKVDVAGEIQKLYAPKPGERAPIKQWFVDVAKARVGITLLKSSLAIMQRDDMDFMAGVICQEILDGLDPEPLVWHLVFPDPHNVNEYLLRKGPRPKRDHLGNKWHRNVRSIDADIRPFSPPESIVRALADMGIEFDPRKVFTEAFLGAKDESLIVQ